LFIIAIITFSAMLGACGSSNSSPPSQGNAQTTPTPTPTPTTTVQPAGATCTFPALADNATVFYGGPKGQGIFTDPSAAYIGTVQTIYSNGDVTVNWPSLSTSSTLSYKLIFPQGTCQPDITGDKAEYTGTQGPSTPNFTTVGQHYTGTVTAIFATGFIEVNWGAPLSKTTVEPLANLAIGN
jgi:hypothetical protein